MKKAKKISIKKHKNTPAKSSAAPKFSGLFVSGSAIVSDEAGRLWHVDANVGTVRLAFIHKK